MPTCVCYAIAVLSMNIKVMEMTFYYPILWMIQLMYCIVITSYNISHKYGAASFCFVLFVLYCHVLPIILTYTPLVQQRMKSALTEQKPVSFAVQHRQCVYTCICDILFSISIIVNYIQMRLWWMQTEENIFYKLWWDTVLYLRTAKKNACNVRLPATFPSISEWY